MLSSVKTSSIIAIILGVMNAFVSVVIYMLLAPSLDPNLGLCIAAFVALTSIVLLILGVGLLNLNNDMETTISSLNGYTHNLKKRVDELEKKL